MLLRREEKAVTRAPNWFCWQCWAREKGKLWLMGWGWEQEAGVFDLKGGSHFALRQNCCNLNLPFCRASMWITDPGLGQNFIAMCTRTLTDTWKQTFTCTNTGSTLGDKEAEKEEESTEKSNQLAELPATSQYTNNRISRPLVAL